MTEVTTADVAWPTARRASYAANLENLTLGDIAKSGTGNGLDNVIRGNDLANKLAGGAGDDDLFGLGGKDKLFGGLGEDFVYTSLGDSFRNEGPDSIKAFNAAEGDRIDLRGIDTSGNDAFTFIGKAEFLLPADSLPL